MKNKYSSKKNYCRRKKHISWGYADDFAEITNPNLLLIATCEDF